ncbi:fumarylacetoacetate hydrolase family protein [Nocardia beijingensis]
MRFATIRRDGGTRAAVITGQRVHPFPPGTTVLDLVRSGLDAALDAGARVTAESAGLALADVDLDVPLRPPAIRDFVTFEEHVEGVRAAVQDASGVPEAWYDAPHFYFTNPHRLLGPGAAVAAPQGSDALDFELEVAAVVGAAGSDLTVDAAAGHLFGYTIFNDWSARDLQGREMQVGLGPAKGKDFGSSLGPWLVTADEFAGHHDSDGFLTLECTARVNDEEVGRDVLTNMGWTFPAMLAYASRDSRVEPGDVLGSGTTGNGGCLAELWGHRGRREPPALRPGDTVSLTVEGIGTLTTPIAARTAPGSELPPFRRRDRAAERALHRPAPVAP